MLPPIHNFYNHNSYQGSKIGKHLVHKSRNVGFLNKNILLLQKVKYQIMITNCSDLFRTSPGCLQTLKTTSPSSAYFCKLTILSTCLILSIKKEKLPVISITAPPRWRNEMLSIFTVHNLSNASFMQALDPVTCKQLHLKWVIDYRL